MYLGNCKFSSIDTKIGQEYITDLDCSSFSGSIDINPPTYTGTGQVYRAGFLGDDGAYYISQDLFFTFLIWFWSIFFVAFSIIALSIKSFKLGSKK
ncbi:MAG: hypothetical protein PHV23_05155 [Candidatus Gracilibacteria bacterium]|nr:hypothetical protein [Candidatus Gracilibacteria bacterium]